MSEGISMKLRRITGLMAVTLSMGSLVAVGHASSTEAAARVWAERQGRNVVVWARETAPQGRTLVTSTWHSRRAYARGLAPARRCTFDYAGPANYACAMRTRDNSHYARVLFDGSLRFAGMLVAQAG